MPSTASSPKRSKTHAPRRRRPVIADIEAWTNPVQFPLRKWPARQRALVSASRKLPDIYFLSMAGRPTAEVRVDRSALRTKGLDDAGYLPALTQAVEEARSTAHLLGASDALRYAVEKLMDAAAGTTSHASALRAGRRALALARGER